MGDERFGEELRKSFSSEEVRNIRHNLGSLHQFIDSDDKLNDLDLSRKLKALYIHSLDKTFRSMVVMENNPECIHPADIKCIVFDFGFTISSDLYFKVVPPEYPQWRDVIQKHVFEEPSIVEPWMEGSLTIVDIARIISRHIPMDVGTIVRTMEMGCERLRFNKAVWDFAQAQRAAGRKTALVTANMDVFTKVVVPSHHLDQVFDVILNTFDYKELRKERLWPIAFQALGDTIHYGNSLLIEDGAREPMKFRKLGGHAYQYSTDEAFRDWLCLTKWNDPTQV